MESLNTKRTIKQKTSKINQSKFIINCRLKGNCTDLGIVGYKISTKKFLFQISNLLCTAEPSLSRSVR